MKKVILALGLLPMLSFADPAVRYVKVNVHNDSKFPIELLNFSAKRLFAGAEITAQRIQPYDSEKNLIFVESFDKEAFGAGVDILYRGQPMTMMWEINLGYLDPEGQKSHLCGVIKSETDSPKFEYCDIPYVIDETLYIDFRFD